MDKQTASRDSENTAATDRFGEHAGHSLADIDAGTGTASDTAVATPPSGTPQPARVAAAHAGPPPSATHTAAWQPTPDDRTPPLPAPQGTRPSRQASAAPANAPDPWLDVAMEVRLHFGGREMLLSEALEIGPGTVIELDRHVDDPVDLLVGDRVVARGEVVVLGGNFALQISEVLAPLPRLESVRCLL